MARDGRTLGDWLAELGGDDELGESLLLAFDSCRIAVRSNSPELVDKLGSYFRDFLADGDGSPDIEVTAIEAAPRDLGLDLEVKQPDPGKTKIKEEWLDLEGGRIVRKRLTGMVFVFGGDRHLAHGPCVANDNQVINFINNRFIQWTLRRGFLLGHAAAVASRGRGVAIAGVSGRGKSTLALEAMAAGLDFVTNDRVMIKREGGSLTMLGVPKLPRINPGTVLNNPALAPVMPEAERLAAAALPEAELWGLEQKYDCFLDRCFGPGRFRLGAEMAGLVLLNWELGGGPLEVRAVDLGERRELLEAFRKDVGLFYEEGDEGLVEEFGPEAYLEALEGCPAFELRGGVDFRTAARACVRFLGGGPMEP